MTYAELYHAEVEAHLEDTQRDTINAAFVGFRHVRSLTWPPRADAMGRDETVVFVRHTVAQSVPEALNVTYNYDPRSPLADALEEMS